MSKLHVVTTARDEDLPELVTGVVIDQDAEALAWYRFFHSCVEGGVSAKLRDLMEHADNPDEAKIIGLLKKPEDIATVRAYKEG